MHNAAGSHPVWEADGKSPQTPAAAAAFPWLRSIVVGPALARRNCQSAYIPTSLATTARQKAHRTRC